jgi:long-chain acyl-CoA synthetase
MAGEPLNLADLVRSAAEASPDKPALLAADGSVSWADLDRQVDALAGALRDRGLERGDRVGLLLPNSVEFAVGYFAVLRAGLAALPLNTAYTAPELQHQLTDSGAGLVVTDEGHCQLVEGPTLVVGSQDWQAALTHEPFDGPRTGAEDLAVLLYTSGTTGQPKGAMLSHRALLANLEQLSRIEPRVVAADDVVLLVLPLFHVYGLNAGLGMTARAGATGVIAERFDPVETLELVRRHRVTNIIGAPPMYVAWSMLPELGEATSTLRLAVSGAAPLPPEVLASVREATGHDIYEGYGLTETAPVLTTTLCSATAKPGSIGRPVPGVQLRLEERTSFPDTGRTATAAWTPTGGSARGTSLTPTATATSSSSTGCAS